MNRKLKISVDILMTVSIILLMAYSLTGQLFHEIMGVSAFILFVLHHILNKNWYKTLAKVRYSKIRILMTVIDFTLFILILLLMGSGILMSRYVFSFLDIKRGMSVARQIHLVASYWGYILISFHIGMHWNIMLQAFNKIKSEALKKLLKILSLIAALYGIYIFISHKIYEYMFLQTLFARSYEGNIFGFFIDYICLMTAFIFISYYICNFIIKSRRKYSSPKS